MNKQLAVLTITLITILASCNKKASIATYLQQNSWSIESADITYSYINKEIGKALTYYKITNNKLYYSYGDSSIAPLSHYYTYEINFVNDTVFKIRLSSDNANHLIDGNYKIKGQLIKFSNCKYSGDNPNFNVLGLRHTYFERSFSKISKTKFKLQLNEQFKNVRYKGELILKNN